MNYLKELNMFYNWLETNQLSSSDILVWHALMHICNKAMWKEEFTVAISVLELKTGLKKDAINRARNNLKELGRIDFTSNGSNKSATYKIVSFESQCDVLNATNSTTVSSTNRAQYQPQSQPINKQYNNNYNNKPKVVGISGFDRTQFQDLDKYYLN